MKLPKAPIATFADGTYRRDPGGEWAVKLVGTTRRTFGENIPPTGLWLGSVRIVTGEIIDIMADILGPYEDAD